MARVTYVKHAQQRYETKPVMENGKPKVVPVLRRNGDPKLTKSGRPITRRVTVEDRTKPKPPRKCEKCGTTIKVSDPARKVKGDPYKWVKPKSGPYGGSMRVRCAVCPTWTQSELSSSKMATAMAAQETAHAAMPDWSDFVGEGITFSDAAESYTQALKDVLAECAEGFRETAQDYQEGLDNMPDGLRDAAYDTQEKIDTLEGEADELEQWDPDSPPDDGGDLDSGGPPEDEAEDADPSWEDVEAEFQSWADTARDSADEAVDNLPL